MPGERSPPADGLRSIDVEGYSLACRTAGAGDPVLLVHGSLNDYRGWAAQFDAFAARFRVVAPSLRHCYPERWNGRGEFSVDRHARDLASLVETMGAAAHVVAHSRGGAVALGLALRRPDLVRTLVLADPAGFEALLPCTPAGLRMREESAAMFERLRVDLASGDATAAARRFAESLGGPGAWERRTPEQREVLLDNIATGPACAERPRFTREALAQITAPILLVTGARSPARYPLMLAEFARFNTNVHAVVVVPDAAHAMHRENPTFFNDAVLRFLGAASRLRTDAPG